MTKRPAHILLKQREGGREGGRERERERESERGGGRGGRGRDEREGWGGGVNTTLNYTVHTKENGQHEHTCSRVPSWKQTPSLLSHHSAGIRTLLTRNSVTTTPATTTITLFFVIFLHMEREREREKGRKNCFTLHTCSRAMAGDSSVCKCGEGGSLYRRILIASIF